MKKYCPLYWSGVIYLKKCSFAGHRDFYDRNIRQKLLSIIEDLVKNHSIRIFFVGNYGAFDRMITGILNEIKKTYSIRIELIVPYLTQEIINNKLFYEKNYDRISIPPFSSSTPNKYKIIKTNEYMIDNSDFLICYVSKEWGGAAKTLEYALKMKKKVINVANTP